MSESDDALAIVVRLARSCERAGVEYLVGGSIASSIHGEPRATRDIDVAVRLDAERMPRLISELGTDFAIDEQMLEEAIRTRGSANIFFLPSFMKVDLFVRGEDEYDRAEFSRRSEVDPLPGQTVAVSSAEDNLLWKLRWFRKGGEVSDQQWRDILGLLRLCSGRLDLPYLRRWAEAHAVGDLLERAAAQAGDPGSGR